MTRNVDGTGQKLEAAYIHESQETIQRWRQHVTGKKEKDENEGKFKFLKENLAE